MKNILSLCGITQYFDTFETKIQYENTTLVLETLYFQDGQVVVKQTTPFERRVGLRYENTPLQKTKTVFYFANNGYAVIEGDRLVAYDNCPYFNQYDKEGKLTEILYKTKEMETPATAREYHYGKGGRLLLVKDFSADGSNRSKFFSYNEKTLKTTVYASIFGDDIVESEIGYFPNGNGKYDCRIKTKDGEKVVRDVELWGCTKA